MPEELKLAHEEIFSLRLSKAVHRIEAYEAKHPNQLTTSYMRFNESFLRLFISEDEFEYDKHKPDLEKWLEKVKDGNENDPYYYLFSGEMHFELSALETKFDNNFGAANHALKGLNLLKEGQEKFPDFEPLFIGTGVLNVALGSLPDNYKFMASFLGYSGDIQKGMRLLKEGVELTEKPQWKYMRTKAVFIYMYIKQQLYGEQESVEKYGLDASDNPILAFLETKTLQSFGRNEELINLLTKVKSDPETSKIPYFDYLLGRAKLYRGDADAHFFLLSFLQENKSSNYKKSTLRYLSWYYRLKGNDVMALMYRQRACLEGTVTVGADAEALQECQMELLPLFLLRARVLYDSGKLLEAERELIGQANSLGQSPVQRLEYHYRLGRVYQSIGRFNSAMSEFALAAKFNQTPTLFARVNAELQWAIVLEAQGEKQLALSHYLKVLEFSDYPWYEGTQQKAKAAIQRLES